MSALLTQRARRGYHWATSRKSRDRRRVPQVRGRNLGFGVTVSRLRFSMPAGFQRYYGRRHLHFITLQLLSPSAALEDRARDPNDNPKTQVQTANLGHPPRCSGS